MSPRWSFFDKIDVPLYYAWHSQHATLKKRIKSETMHNGNIPKKIKSTKWQRSLLIKLIIILVPIFYHCVNLIIILYIFDLIWSADDKNFLIRNLCDECGVLWMGLLMMSEVRVLTLLEGLAPLSKRSIFLIWFWYLYTFNKINTDNDILIRISIVQFLKKTIHYNIYLGFNSVHLFIIWKIGKYWR